MQIDQDASFVPVGDTGLRYVGVLMHASHGPVYPADGKNRPVAFQIVLHKARHPLILLQEFRILHIFQVFRNVGFSFGTEKGR